MQAAAFLRIVGGDHPLDATAVHPERYELVARIASDAGTDVAALLGNQELVRRIDFSRYVSHEVARPTLDAIRRRFGPPAATDLLLARQDAGDGHGLEAGIRRGKGCFAPGQE